MTSHKSVWLVALVVSLTISGCSILSGCSIFFPEKPTVVINSPPSSSSFRAGDVVSVQSTASDPKGIARVELAADGNVVHIATPPNPESNFTATQTWTAASDGVHTLTVRAFNSSNTPSDPASIAVLVGAPTTTTPVAAPAITQAAAPTPLGLPSTPTTGAATGAAASAATPANCANNSTFVQDVSVPDGTTLKPGQPFDKVWRVRNTGTCPWNGSYRLSFVGGVGMTQNISAPVPDTPPGGTADLSISLMAPTKPGSQTSLWQLQAPDGVLFGATLNVTIRVAGAPTVAHCSGTPTIESFSASPTSITAGQSATLNWGFVSNADTADIDNVVGGIATPGSTTVKPTTTTTYTLTAHCGSTTTTAQVTIAVAAAAPTAAPSPSATPSTPTRQVTGTVSPTTPGATIVRCSIQSESGQAVKAGSSFSASQTLDVGDDNENRTHRPFFSFDVSDLAGKTIDQGNLTIGTPTVKGNPILLGPLFVESVEYSPPVVGSYYDRSGTQLLVIFGAPAGTYDLRTALQNAVKANRNRFQLRFRLAAENNGNSSPDSYTWSNNEVCLSITFH